MISNETATSEPGPSKPSGSLVRTSLKAATTGFHKDVGSSIFWGAAAGALVDSCWLAATGGVASIAPLTVAGAAVTGGVAHLLGDVFREGTHEVSHVVHETKQEKLLHTLRHHQESQLDASLAETPVVDSSVNYQVGSGENPSNPVVKRILEHADRKGLVTLHADTTNISR